MQLFRQPLKDEFREAIDAGHLRVASVKPRAVRTYKGTTAPDTQPTDAPAVWRVELVDTSTGVLIGTWISATGDIQRAVHHRVVELAIASERKVFNRGWSRHLAFISVLVNENTDAQHVETFTNK